MQKFIAIPYTRYTGLKETEKQHRISKEAIGSVKEATNALVKNQETQEFIQRQQQYKEKDETIPKSLDKEIPRQAFTTIPPPSQRVTKRRPVELSTTKSGMVIPAKKKFSAAPPKQKNLYQKQLLKRNGTS